VFKQLETDGAAAGVDAFGVSCTTMEEVFLKVGQDGLPDGDEAAGLDENEFLLGKSGVGEDGVSSNSEKLTGCGLWFQQFRALFLKRAINAKRNKYGTGAVILLPAVLAWIGIALSNKASVAEVDIEDPCRKLSFNHPDHTEQTVYLGANELGFDHFSSQEPGMKVDLAALGAQPNSTTMTDLFKKANGYVAGNSIATTDFTGKDFSEELLKEFTEPPFTDSGVFRKNFVGETFAPGITWITAVADKGCQYSSHPEKATGGANADAKQFVSSSMQLAPNVWYSFAFDRTFDEGATATLKDGDANVLWTSKREYRKSGTFDAAAVPVGVQVLGHMAIPEFNWTKYVVDLQAEDEANNVEPSEIAKESQE
jgi:hypothetical protein